MVFFAPVLLVLPGYLAFLGLAPRWMHLHRLVAGLTATIAALPLATWVSSAVFRLPYSTGLVWSVWLGLVAVGGGLALWKRKEWTLRTPRPEKAHLGLAGVLVLACAFTYWPRVRYAFPIHVDEWWSLAAARAIEAQRTVGIIDPRLGLFRFGWNPEAGFHLLLVDVRSLTGADALAMFNVGPTMLWCAAVVAAWCVGRRGGYALEAAFFVALVPTSVRTLGPQFLVPLSLGLFFILGIFLVFTQTDMRRTWPVLLSMLVYLVFAHPQSAAAAGFLVAAYGAATLRKHPWRAAGLMVLASVPFVLGYWLLRDFVPLGDLGEASSRLPVPDFLELVAFPVALLFLVGVWITVQRPSAERFAWIATTAVHLGVIAAFLVARVGQHNLYDRAWMHGVLTLSMTAAFATHELRTVPRRPLARAAVLAVVLLVVAGSTVAAQKERNEGYYHLVGDETYADMLWIREHVPPDGTALVDPAIGTPFATLTGHHVYAATPLIGGSYDRADLAGRNNANLARRVLMEGAVDDRFLDNYGIDLVYTEIIVKNPAWTEIHPRVWVRA